MYSISVRKSDEDDYIFRLEITAKGFLAHYQRLNECMDLPNQHYNKNGSRTYQVCLARFLAFDLQLASSRAQVPSGTAISAKDFPIVSKRRRHECNGSILDNASPLRVSAFNVKLDRIAWNLFLDMTFLKLSWPLNISLDQQDRS